MVCGRRERGRSPYRLPILTREPQPGAKAEVRLTDRVNLAAETESATVGGIPSNRAMIRLKLKF